MISPKVDETEEEVHTSEEKWDGLLAKPEAQQVMVDMAREALAEEKAGLTTELDFDDDGKSY